MQFICFALKPLVGHSTAFWTSKSLYCKVLQFFTYCKGNKTKQIHQQPHNIKGEGLALSNAKTSLYNVSCIFKEQQHDKKPSILYHNEEWQSTKHSFICTTMNTFQALRACSPASYQFLDKPWYSDKPFCYLALEQSRSTQSYIVCRWQIKAGGRSLSCLLTASVCECL